MAWDGEEIRAQRQIENAGSYNLRRSDLKRDIKILTCMEEDKAVRLNYVKCRLNKTTKNVYIKDNITM